MGATANNAPRAPCHTRTSTVGRFASNDEDSARCRCQADLPFLICCRSVAYVVLGQISDGRVGAIYRADVMTGRA